MATTLPLGLQALDGLDLVGGQHVGDHVLGVDADLRGDRLGDASRCRRSAGPGAARARAAARWPRRWSSLTASATTRTPRAWPSQPTATAVPPAAWASSSASRRSAERCWDQSASRRRPTDEDGVPVDEPLHAEALDVREVLDRRPAGRRRVAGAGGDRPRDRVLGGVLERAGQPQDLVGVLAGPGDDVDQGHPAGGDGAGLVEDDRCRRVRVGSSTSGPLIRMPSWAPRPVPTISAVGVARPSAHGQAMISTATAAVNAARPAVAGAEPEAEGGDGERDHDGHEDPGDPVGEPLHLGLAVLGVLDQPGHLSQLGVRADPGGATTSRPPALTVAPTTRRRRRPRRAPTRR